MAKFAQIGITTVTEPKLITMKDIAREFGVSVATVSRALSDNRRISKERREAIQAFAREHNFYPNIIGEQLRHSQRNRRGGFCTRLSDGGCTKQ